MPSDFTIMNFLKKGDKESLDKTMNPEPVDKRREVQVASFKNSSVSKVVAETLIEVMKNNKDDYQQINEPSNPVFSKIKVIATEDINATVDEAIRFAKDADVLIVPTDGLKTLEEDFFLNNINIEEKEVYYSLESFMANSPMNLRHSTSSATGDRMLDEKNDTPAQIHELRVGDVVLYGGREVTIKYLDECVVLIHSCVHEGVALPIDYQVVRYGELGKPQPKEASHAR